MCVGSQGANRFCYLRDDIDKFCGFCRRHPGHVQTIAFDTHQFHQVGKKGEFSPCVVITFQVMAVSGMSPRNPNAVGTVSESCQGELRAHAARAGDADNPYVGWILHPADTGKVRSAITAPIAQEGYNFWFPFRHRLTPLLGAGRSDQQRPALDRHRSGSLNSIQHGKDLIVVKSVQMDRAGSTGGHAKTAPFAKGGIDRRLSGKHPCILVNETRRRIRANGYAPVSYTHLTLPTN